MSLANVFIKIMLTYYSLHIIKMIFSKKNRVSMQQTNEQLEKLRKIPCKTKEEQMEFINLKYPKGRFKWSWKMIPTFLMNIFIFIVLFRTYSFLLNYFNINFIFWQAILFIIFFPLILNLILEKFNLQKGDLSVFFRGNKK